jgi:chemotaxis signal transduction protein
MRERRRFDWQAIHAELDRRLAEVGRTIDDDRAQARELMLARSRALAATRDDKRAAKDLARVLTFRLGEERYGLLLDRAREVVGLSRYAPLPGSGPGILGIVNWRGEFAVVFDLAPLLGLAAASDTEARRVIVLRDQEPPLALAVDAVDEVVRVDLETLQAPSELRTRQPEMFRGATKDAVLVLSEDALRERLIGELQAA